MSTFVDVPADVLIGFLVNKGFTRRDGAGSEIVYERKHERDPRYRVLVYTSIRAGRSNARAKGKDAIRVCAIYEDEHGPRGVAKLPRVHRTGSVEGTLERMIARAREAYARCNWEIGRGRKP